MNSFVPWDIRVTIDLFLGGMGIGAFLLALVAGYLGEPYRLLKKTAAIVSPIAVCTGLLFLISELGRPGRFITTLFNNNSASVMSWGVYLQTGFVIFAVVYALLIIKQRDDDGIAGLIKWVGGLFAIGVGIYHGFLLSSNVGAGLWNNGALPVMIFVSSLLTGISLVVVINAAISTNLASSTVANETAAGKEGSTLFNINLINAVLLVVELIAVLAWLFTLARGSQIMSFGLNNLLSNYPVQWWLGAVVVGIVIPLLLSLYGLKVGKNGQESTTIIAAGAVLILIGGFVLKNVILVAGQIKYPLF